jgi:hypothetical protein
MNFLTPDNNFYNPTYNPYTITVSGYEYSEAYPLLNMCDIKLDKKYRGGGTIATTAMILFTLNYSSDIDFYGKPDSICIISQSFLEFSNYRYPSTLKLTIRGNDIDSWYTPAYSKVIYDATTDNHKDKFSASIDSEVGYQYWSLLIENLPMYHFFDIEYLFLGNRIEIEDPDAITPVNLNNKSLYAKSESGVLFGYNSTIPYLRNLSLKWSWLDEEDMKNLVYLFSTFQKSMPFILIWNMDEDYALIPNLYCNFVSDLSIPKMIDFRKVGAQISVEECR